MPIYVDINDGTSNKEFELVSEGIHSGIIADIGITLDDGPYGKKEQVEITWLTDEADSEGRTKRMKQWFGASLFPGNAKRPTPAKFFAFVKQLTGKVPEGDYTDNSKDRKRFDIESLVGLQANLFVQHYTKQDGNDGAKIGGITKPTKKLAVPSDFVRKDFSKPRTPSARPLVPAVNGLNGRTVAAAVLQPAFAGATNEDIPF